MIMVTDTNEKWNKSLSLHTNSEVMEGVIVILSDQRRQFFKGLCPVPVRNTNASSNSCHLVLQGLDEESVPLREGGHTVVTTGDLQKHMEYLVRS